MKFRNILVVIAASLMLSACADWIYRIDVPQGNFLDEKDVKKLRIDMTSFDHDTWYYLYQMKRGMAKRGKDFRKELTLSFVDNRVSEVSGDFELSEDFYTPLDE